MPVIGAGGAGAGAVTPAPAGDPVPPTPPDGASAQVSSTHADPETNFVRVFGGLKRGGRFRLEERTTGALVFADATYDLREAEVPQHAEITIYSLFGDVKIIVPPGMTVRSTGAVIFGDDKIETTHTDTPGPTLTVHRVGAFGDLKVKSALPGEQLPKRWRWF
ncbi:MAG: LiaF-related protein [Micrococcales bacterium]|nr:LiaF-related protein [Micrococcales bacterium]